MKCPVCVDAGQRSWLAPQPVPKTALGWTPHYDEDGIYHVHDPNGRGQHFSCSKGHRFVAAFHGCPACRWGASEVQLIQ